MPKALATADRPHRMSEQKPVEKTRAKTNPMICLPALTRYTFANFVVGKPNELAFAVGAGQRKVKKSRLIRYFYTAVLVLAKPT